MSRRSSPPNLMIQGTPDWLAWLDRLGVSAGMPSRAATIDLALALLAEQIRHGPPPPRARPVGTNRFGTPGKTRA